MKHSYKPNFCHAKRLDTAETVKCKGSLAVRFGVFCEFLAGIFKFCSNQNLIKGLPQSIFITSTSSEEDCFAVPCRRTFSFRR